MKKMLNQIVLVGRMVEEVKIIEENEKKYGYMDLKIQRSYKNNEGIFEEDIIPVKLWGQVAENTCEYCKKGSIVGIKGRIENNNNELIIIADKVTFLSSRKVGEE
jgi:single-strand DNA-binding protein